MENRFKQQGAFSWCELMTTDVEAAKAFYSELFGWRTEDMTMPEMRYTVVKAADEGVGGIMRMPQQAPEGMPPMWGAYVTVDNVDKTAQTAERLGGRVLVAPTDIPKVGRFCVLQDPQGAVINAITYVNM